MPSGPSSSEIKKHSSKTLKVGSKGDAVKCLQQCLNQQGGKLEVDGDFGKGTKKSVSDFQKKKKLGVDGIVGPKTWAALAGKKPPKEEQSSGKDKSDASSKSSSGSGGKNAGGGECSVRIEVTGFGSAVSDAVVQVGRGKKVKTDRKGIATLQVPAGKHTLEVSKSGAKKKQNIRAVAGSSLKLQVRLESKR